MPFQSLEHLAQAQIHECATRAVSEFKSSVRPIYGLKEERLTHVGSCLLLVVNGRNVLSTAAHVADNLIHSPLFVAGPVGTHPVQLQGKFRGTSAPAGDRREDHFDCAYCVLSKEETAALGAVEFLQDSRFSHNRAPTEGRAFTAFGYAVSRNKKSIDFASRAIANRLSMFTGSIVDVPALAARLPRGREAHLMLKFDRHVYTVDGERVNAFGPKGLSGGALLDLGDFTSPAIYAARSLSRATLSGMLIEHWAEHRVLLAVNIRPIVEGIRLDLS